MDCRTLGRILRIEGLIPFTGSAILLGAVVTLRESGTMARWDLFVIAAIAALLIHMDAHIWNDIMDLEVDRHEKSRETGRPRPLVSGWATVPEYRAISAVITVIVLVLAAFLTTQRAWMPLLLLAGFFFDYGYNHPSFALAYHPFTEWYLFPWLVVAVTVTVMYAATGTFSPAGFILSLLNGMAATCFVVSMMRRDTSSDRLGGKCTSSVCYPALPHATIYGITTMFVSCLMLLPLAEVLGDLSLAYLLVLVTSAIAGINTVLGARIDQLCTRAMYSVFPDFEADAHSLVVQQIGATMLHAAAVSIVLLAWRGI